MSPTVSVEGEGRDKTAHRHAKRYLLLKLATRAGCCCDSFRRGKYYHLNSVGVLWDRVGSASGLHLGGREAQNRGGGAAAAAAAEAGPAAETDD